MSIDPYDMTNVVAGDQAWVLASNALVQLMTPGVAFFYGGLVGENTIVSTLMMSYGCMGIITLLWSLVGYTMAFGPSTSTGVIGADGPLSVIGNKFGNQLRQLGWNADGTPMYGTITEHNYAMFQLMFAIITVAIISGSVVGKIKYVWFMAFVSLWHLLVYCPLAHWFFFYDGWGFIYGTIDFAGGLVVHTSSGVSALVLTWWLGKPKVKHHHAPHNVPYVLLGAALLWFGWFGFNAGSALGATALAARAFTNTQHAAAMAMMTWGAMEFIFSGDKWFTGRPTAVGAATGAVIGLVGVTPACGYVSNEWALFIGFFTVVVCFFSPKFVRWIGIDDRLDCFAAHGVGGITGSLLTGLFASIEYGASSVDGGFYGNGLLFAKQLAGVCAAVLMSVVMTTAIYWFLQGCARLFNTDIRIPDEHQHEVDVSQHGEKAYFRSVKTADTSSSAPVKSTEQTDPIITVKAAAAATPDDAPVKEEV